ncbi:DUF998 domain-containing protein [Nonomuraea cavernae]|uniref:DUF998 domain-containing protein n=1 Tax=Nonomuraea cavernae TaxID=2045107 RepID=A0A918DJJ0_9ACTN|nr:DUF998 domain-containing protein [Nonomuraea cavernae]MCA2190521.1 DUF998 domain-containing protein [Nonomuraea cavernae]GGO70478.1 hypothetical protein GCM10012289_33970 [Nonomuraea cavernae]
MTPRSTGWATVLSALAAVACLTYTEVTLPGQTLISDYALLPGGMVPVLIGMLALAAACLFLAYGLAAREPARTAATRVLLLATAAGLMLSALFPTDPAFSEVNSLGGEIHRWSAAVVFTALPVAGWTLARAREVMPRWNLVRAVSLTSALTLAAYLAAHPASFVSSLINGGAYYGLLERGLVLAEIGLIVVMALTSARARPAAPVAAAPERRTERSERSLAA